MRPTTALLIVLLLLAGVFTLATTLQPRTLHWAGRSPSDSVMKLLLGDSRRMFANQFFVEADVAFHSGYYPSIFDEARQTEEQNSDVAHPDADEGKQLEKGFLGPPTDWIDAFGRHFRPVVHTHLHGKKIGEMLPYLRIATDLDPHQIQTYLVTAYWLEHMHKPVQAVSFLQEGLRNNMKNPALLNELGWIYFNDLHELSRARNLWLAALRCWHEIEAPKPEPDKHLLGEILGGLVRVAEQTHQDSQLIEYLTELKAVSPNPGAIQKLIDEIERKGVLPSAPADQ